MSVTNNYEEISRYCNSIKDSKSLSREEEKILAEKIQAGDRLALNKLVTANLKYVVRVAKRFAWANVSIYDLISEGNLALLHAATKFNPAIGTKFITYADRWIRQAMSEYITKLNLDKENIGYVAAYDEDGIGEEPADYEVVDNIYTEHSRDKALNELLSCLQEREYKVLERYFGLNDTEPKTLEEIGNEMGLTQERVRQIKDCGIEKLQMKAISNNAYAEFKELY